MRKKKEYVEMGRVQVGVVGVDSGNILLCDPCYIDGEWDPRDEYRRDQVYDVTFNGEKSVYDMGAAIEQGIIFTTPLEKYGNMTMNDLVAEGMAVERPAKETGVFGYNGCCQASGSPKGGGQLKYRLGHDGAGVCVRTAYGDGVYPVFVRYNKEGRVRRVEIDFD